MRNTRKATIAEPQIDNEARGAKKITKAELSSISTPEPTDTYAPIPHCQLTDIILTHSQNILRDYVLIDQQYTIARNGAQLFASLTFKGKESDDIGPMVAFQNSHDRSMCLALTTGACVFSQGNLILEPTGGISAFKRHTKNLLPQLEDTTVTILYKSQLRFHKVMAEMERLKSVSMDSRLAAEMSGRLYFEKILSPRQLTTARDEWLCCEDANVPLSRFTFFMVVLGALKTTPPLIIMEKHLQAYQTVVKAA